MRLSGLRTKLIYPDDSYVTYAYDELGRLVKIEDDSSNTLAEYSYDELSRRTLLKLGSDVNDVNVVYVYDIASHLTKITNNFDSNDTMVFEYTDFDDVGNRLSMKIDTDGNDAHVYEYDKLYQIISVDYNDGNSTIYGYDKLGNRTDMNETGVVTNYNNNSLNQYTLVGGTSYSYDDNGNLTDVNDSNNVTKYYYDCENRLTDVNDPNENSIATYSYDYLGRRVSKTVSGTTTEYCYDGDQVIAEYTGGGTLLRKFVYGPGIDEPICMIDVSDNNSVYYYHFDGLGNVRALSDDNGDIVEGYTYDIFGECTVHTSAGNDGSWLTSDGTTATVSAYDNPYLFTGRRYDD